MFQHCPPFSVTICMTTNMASALPVQSGSRDVLMKDMLNKVGLGHLKQRFEEERVDIEIICSASDLEISRLGVSTLGDRIRLKEICKDHIKKKGQNSSSAGEKFYSDILRKRSNLFNTGRSRISIKKSKIGAKKGRPWTISFVCLASKYACRVPSNDERGILQNAGLGFKKNKC